MASSTRKHLSVLESPPPFDEIEWAKRDRFSPPPSRFLEITVLAAGERAHRFAKRLQRHPCFWPDYRLAFAGGRVFTFATTSARNVDAQERALEHLATQIAASSWVVIFLSDDGPWETFLADEDPAVRNLLNRRIQFIDLRETRDMGSSSAAFWRRCRRGLLVGHDSCPGIASGNQHLSGVPEAIAYTLLKPGFVCLDWEKVHDKLYRSPGVAVAGCGNVERGGSLEIAIKRAFAHWRRNSEGVGSPAELIMLVVGASVEEPSSARELDVIGDRAFAEALDSDAAWRILATPVLPPGPSEAVVITKHRPDRLDAWWGLKNAYPRHDRESR